MNNPLEAVTQAVNSLVTALKLPDESAKANEVLGEMSFPQFSRLLPYRDYNQESGLFMNDTTMGFMLEAIPINGANESIVEALDHMLRTKLPRGIPLCIHLMSSQLVGDRIEYGLREFSWSGEQAERFNAITRAYYMKAAATQFPLPEGMNLPLTLRHYRVFISYCSPSKKKSRADILEMENLVKIIRASLQGASITTQTVDAQAFIDIVGEMINHNPDSLYPKRRQLDPYSDLNYQCVEDSFDLKVRADYLTLGLRENGRNSTARILNFHLARNPEIAFLWNVADNYSNLLNLMPLVADTSGADSTMSAQDSMMASRMRSAVESYAKAHNISNEQATQELASRSTRASAGMYGDAHAEWGVKPKILGVGGGLGVRGGGRAGIDWSDDDAHQASSGSRASYDARHDIDAKASKDFKEASDYFTSRKVSESGSHTDNNADSRVDQLSAALNSAKQSYDQYTTNMTRSHEYAEMASRTESMSGQMSEDLSQQFAQYVMKHAPQDAEAILTNTSSPEIAERRRAMAWSFVQEQIQPGVDNAWRESRGDIGKGMESVPSGGGSQDIIADHQGHQAIIEQRTQDSNIRNDVKHQVDNMVTEYKGNIGDTQNSIRGEENIVRGQYSELQNHHKTEALSQNNKYNEEKSAQERMPGADSPQELMKRAKEYQDKYKQ
ncbi:TraC family protein [Escherichia coli]